MSDRKARRKASPLRTAEQARAWLRDNGISAAQFARDHNLSLDAVKEVLLGRSKANYGKAHLAAVALGIKRNPQIPTLSPKSTRTG
ncbi:DNA-binding protein [Pseudoxanthomonas wuyuanensis]|uniref:Phage-associated protein, BcepMu gp16 family n=1 Tax=Pseudoxanthomonas wuyuanensis TaxID=1073196 RepID=A0A286D4Q6_9GAMM|nr:DNA-binding protein [Pseudoxanthomonas wuyuanensis]KAF1719789.1 DNA-binding protein [Pseudoxanthomonas wuyuanensis]SOD53635.1 phage-associated protein, BcepMu gp16 family [Pseudoxanthomonas wuyuanensis]